MDVVKPAVELERIPIRLNRIGALAFWFGRIFCDEEAQAKSLGTMLPRAGWWCLCRLMLQPAHPKCRRGTHWSMDPVHEARDDTLMGTRCPFLAPERPGRLLTLWTGSIPDTFTARL